MSDRDVISNVSITKDHVKETARDKFKSFSEFAHCSGESIKRISSDATAKVIN